MRKRSLFVLLAALCLFAVPAFSASLPPYTVSHSPERPQKGELLAVEIRLEGEAEARLGAIQLGKGLSLEASSSRPFVDTATGKRGALLRLELRVQGEGSLRVESVELWLSSGRFLLGPFAFDAAGSEKSGPLRRDWRWAGPLSVYRYEAFGVRLEGGPSAGASASFEAPEGAAFEPAEDALSWTVTALLPGRLILPEARVETRPASQAAPGKAPPFQIEVKELPAALDSTRAIGDFSLRFERLGAGPARVGDTLRFRLTLSGAGNQPALLFPEPDVSLEQAGKPAAPLSPSLLRTARSDALRPSPSGYEGSSLLEIALEAPRAGALRLTPKPFPVLAPDGSVSILRASPVEVEIRPLEALAAPAAKAADPFDGPKGGRLSEASRLSEAGRLWRKGEKGGALALLYRQSRERPYDAYLSAIAAACEAETGAGPRLRDSLPPPELFLLGVLPFFLLAVGLFLLYRRNRRGAKRPALLVGASLAALLALLLLGFSVASSSERGVRYAVVWSQEAFVVPSALAEGRLPLVRGVTARVIGLSPGYVGLRFPDGSSGWVHTEYVDFY